MTAANTYRFTLQKTWSDINLESLIQQELSKVTATTTRKQKDKKKSIIKEERNMQAKAVAKIVRIAPRKVRLVLDLIRGKEVREAMSILQLTNKRASPVVEKLIKSAAA